MRGNAVKSTNRLRGKQRLRAPANCKLRTHYPFSFCIVFTSQLISHHQVLRWANFWTHRGQSSFPPPVQALDPIAQRVQGCIAHRFQYTICNPTFATPIPVYFFNCNTNSRHTINICDFIFRRILKFVLVTCLFIAY